MLGQDEIPLEDFGPILPDLGVNTLLGPDYSLMPEDTRYTRPNSSTVMNWISDITRGVGSIISGVTGRGQNVYYAVPQTAMNWTPWLLVGGAVAIFALTGRKRR